MISIDLAPTNELHERLASLVLHRTDDIAQGIASANHAIRARGVTFGGEKDMPIAASALILSEIDIVKLQAAANTLWTIIEKVLDWLHADRARLERYAGDHRRMFPWLRKTPGCSTWQVFSRYDAVVTAEGQVRFIECNTGCPAGFLHAIDFSQATQSLLAKLGMAPLGGVSRLGMIRPQALVEGILSVEGRSGIEPGSIAILTDENNLKLELDLLQQALEERDRHAPIVDARALTFAGGRLRAGGAPISAAFLKVRVSTPDSPHHCWRPGFETRYDALLSAMDAESVAPVNNLCALTVAEDKGMLASLFLPEVREQLTQGERDFVDESIPWTARLAPGPAAYRGDRVDLLPFVEKHRDAFVLKPANEGRGFEVHVGRFTSDEDWRRLCRPNPCMPMVVQEFEQPVSLPAACVRAGTVEIESMYLTIALAMVNGRYEGILSRISPSIVTNVGRQGFVQAVLVV